MLLVVRKFNNNILYIYIFVCRVFCTNTVPGTSTAKQYTTLSG